MKKLYTATIAAMFAVSAIAGNGLQLREIQNKKHLSTPAPIEMQKKAIIAKPAGISKAPAKTGAAISDVEGNYTVHIGDYYFDTSQGPFDEECTVSAEGDLLVFECDYFESEVIATYDASNGTISFTEQEIGTIVLAGKTYYVKFEPFAYTKVGDKGSVNPTPYTVSFDKATGVIDFPADHGFSWIAYSDNKFSVFAGYLNVFDVEDMDKNTNDPNEGWSSLGNATFMDGWILPVLGIDQTDEANWYKVELQQNDTNKNMYRLVDPYKGESPAAQYNASTKNGYIQFDVTDPEHVLFMPVDAGFVNSQLEFTKLYCLNFLSWAMGYNESSAAEIIAILGDEIAYTTFADGVVNIPAELVDGKWECDAVFGDQSGIYAGYSWNDNNGDPINMAAKIIFPTNSEAGIGNITAADENQAVKFYNLQGIEISNPHKGQVVIRKQGTTVSKIIAR